MKINVISLATHLGTGLSETNFKLIDDSTVLNRVIGEYTVTVEGRFTEADDPDLFQAIIDTLIREGVLHDPT